MQSRTARFLVVAAALVFGCSSSPHNSSSSSSDAGMSYGSSSGSASSGGSGSSGGSAPSSGSGASSGTSGGSGSNSTSSGSFGSNGGSGSSGSSGSRGSSGAAVGSKGCGKSSTVTFGSVPGENAGNDGKGTGQGGYVTLTDSAAGGARGFAMRLPDNYDNTKPYWLIFAYHWNGGSAADIDSGGTNGYWWSYYGLQRKSENGAIFVTPDSIGAGWSNPKNQDLYFTDDMIKLVTDNYCVDMSNIITSGFSWGGGMSYTLATYRANASTAGYAFRAAVVYEGGNISGADTTRTFPIALWQTEGLTDTTVSMSLATPLRDQFVKNNGCTGWTSDDTPPVTSTNVSTNPPVPPTPGQWLDPGGHICSNYTGCSAGHPIRWCVSQSGHGPGPIDGNSSLYNPCANPPSTCSASCPCTWTPDDVWTWLNDPSSNARTPNNTGN